MKFFEYLCKEDLNSTKSVNQAFCLIKVKYSSVKKGHTRFGEELRELIAMAEMNKNGILLDEAYEFYHASGGVSGIGKFNQQFIILPLDGSGF